METNINTEAYKTLLEEELKKVEGELKTVGRINPNNPQDWEAVPEEMDTHRSEADEVADNIEAFEGNSAILKQLEIRYNEIKGALERIEKGTYGICEVGGEVIEKERLDANPSARTCLKHLEN